MKLAINKHLFSLAYDWIRKGIYLYICVFFFDFFQLVGGYDNRMFEFSLLFSNIAFFFILFIILSQFVQPAGFIIQKQWGKFIVSLIRYGIFTVLFFSILMLLNYRSKQQALHIIESYFYNNKPNGIEVICNDKNITQDFNAFKTHYDPIAIKVLVHVPPFVDSQFLISPKSTKPFIISISKKNGKIKFRVHRNGIK